ncbi:MAG: segregation/condensation protein A [Parcubacteria group bacterium]|nr:segregation/condensation protein A [Parcubacteria group bacterium]
MHSALSYRVSLDVFEGPFSLLLQLLDEKKLRIDAISLAQVTDQYLETIRSHCIDPDEIASFLSVASSLILKKSRLLIPEQVDDILDDVSLEARLMLYREFSQSAKKILSIIRKHSTAYQANGTFTLQTKERMAPKNMTEESLSDAFFEVMRRNFYLSRPSQAYLKNHVSLIEKVTMLKDSLLKRHSLLFSEFTRASSREEVILYFLALMEMMKMPLFHVSQRANFQEISLNYDHRKKL